MKPALYTLVFSIAAGLGLGLYVIFAPELSDQGKVFVVSLQIICLALSLLSAYVIGNIWAERWFLKKLEKYTEEQDKRSER